VLAALNPASESLCHQREIPIASLTTAYRCGRCLPGIRAERESIGGNEDRPQTGFGPGFVVKVFGGSGSLDEPGAA
jgi:hypothetical protein